MSLYKYQSPNTVVQSIFDQYLHEGNDSFSSVASTEAGTEEDLVLAALVVLEEDNRATKRKSHPRQVSQERLDRYDEKATSVSTGDAR